MPKKKKKKKQTPPQRGDKPFVELLFLFPTLD